MLHLIPYHLESGCIANLTEGRQISIFYRRRSTRPKMTSRKLLCALIGALLLLASPMAWGCDSRDMTSCQMAPCTMSVAGSSMPDCHETAGASQNRGSLAPASSACCQAPLDREPIDSAPTSQIDLSSTPFLAEVDMVAVQEELETPSDSDTTVASQRHELGRYTLLSSYLI